MACDSMIPQGMTQEERQAEIKAALAELEQRLKAKTAKLTVAINGGVVIDGWQNRKSVNDACAVRKLLAANSWEMRKAIAAAEQASGRKVNVQAVSGGLHSHDGGKTWHKD